MSTNYNPLFLGTWDTRILTPDEKLKELRERANYARSEYFKFAKENDLQISESEKIVIIQSRAYSLPLDLAADVERLQSSLEEANKIWRFENQQFDDFKSDFLEMERIRERLTSRATPPESDY